MFQEHCALCLTHTVNFKQHIHSKTHLKRLESILKDDIDEVLKTKIAI